MRLTITTLIFLLPVFVCAQSSKHKVDTVVINDLVNSWTLGLNDEGDDPADIRVFNKYKSLFWPGAIVYDDVNGVFDPESSNDPQPYKTKIKPFDVYAHDIALQFKNLAIGTEGVITYDLDSIASDSVIRVTLTRKIYGEKYRQYVIDDIDSLVENLIKHRKDIEEVNTGEVKQAIVNLVNDRENRTYKFESTHRLLIRMKIINDTIRISSILNDDVAQVENFRCLNDNDHDGVIDEEDKCPGSLGDFTAFGCIDSDLDGIADAEDQCDFIYGVRANSGCPKGYFTSNFNISAWVGVQMNITELNMPELDQLGYSFMDFNQSEKGKIDDPGLILSPVIGADIAYFFGKKKKRAGVSLGITYTGFSATYELTEDAVYTFKSNDGQDDYRRRVSLNAGSKEEIGYKIINVPVLFRYRDMLGKKNTDRESYKWHLEFSAGPSFIFFANTSKYNSNIDFEGLYQIDTINKDGITYYDYFDNGSTWNVFVTADNINQQDSIPGADVVFDLLNNYGYDFAEDKNYTGKDNSVSRSSIAFNAKFDACYKFDDKGKLALKFGGSILIAPLPDQSSGYQLMDKTSDAYNSIYNANAKSVYYSFGINVGLVLNL